MDARIPISFFKIVQPNLISFKSFSIIEVGRSSVAFLNIVKFPNQTFGLTAVAWKFASDLPNWCDDWLLLNTKFGNCYLNSRIEVCIEYHHSPSTNLPFRKYLSSINALCCRATFSEEYSTRILNCILDGAFYVSQSNESWCSKNTAGNVTNVVAEHIDNATMRLGQFLTPDILLSTNFNM